MKILELLKKLIGMLYKSLKRFPLSITSSALLASTLIVQSETKNILNGDQNIILAKLAMIFALGIPLFLCIKLLIEKKDLKNTYKLLILYFSGILLLVLYYFFLINDKFDMVSITRYIAVSISLYIAFIFIPYIPYRNNFERYVIKILTDFFITVIYSGVLFFGLAAILFTIDKLLGIKIQSEMYYYTWLFVSCIFAPTYFLSDIPRKSALFDEAEYSKILKILILYIVMPLLSVYTIILYIYFIKIIVTFNWPIGLVSHLVIWYSIICVLVLFLITPLLDKNKWAKVFMVYFPKAIIPILIMMFVSMGIRINAYGVTESRYYVIIIGLWIFGIMLYFGFKKSLKNTVIPISICIISLISVFGPLSSYSISKFSQNSRIKSILIKNDMLAEDKIVIKTISKQDRQEISSILEYFNRNHSLKDVKVLPPDFKMEDMNRVFGFEYEYIGNYDKMEYFFFEKEQEGNYDISGYDYLIDNRSLYNKSFSDKNNLDVSYDMDKALLNISYKNKLVYSKPLYEFTDKLVEKYGFSINKNNIPTEEMTFIDENSNIKIKIIFMNMSGNINAIDKDPRMNSYEFYVLVKIK